MDRLHNLLKEITELTTNMETDYPELYNFLGENPVTIPTEGQPDIGVEVFKDYLESLKQLLKHHIELHKTSNVSSD